MRPSVLSGAKVAVVTGAAQGIGEATARRLARLGCDIAVLDIKEKGTAVADAIQAEGRRALFLRCDVTDLSAVRQAAERVEREFGAVDVLVNNVGWTPYERFLDQPAGRWERIMAVNFFGVLYCCKEFLPRMRDGSAVVNVSSDGGRVGVEREAVYAAAKAGVTAFSKSLALELSSRRIRVNVVSPGSILTPLAQTVRTDEEFEQRAQSNPLGRVGVPDDVAEAIAALALDLGYVNAQVLSVNGGALRVD